MTALCFKEKILTPVRVLDIRDSALVSTGTC